MTRKMTTIGWLVACVMLTLQARPAEAWKPKTHVYLAQEAWEDAKDGKVTLYRVDYETGERGASLGEFAVSPELLDAIRRYPASYFAGVLGPDAYPDMVTGQMRVHPPGRGAPDDPDLNENGPGTPPWLRKLWMHAFAPASSAPAKAFVAGYLAHAAADVYAHTYVNGFTGGIFDLTTSNGVKHMLVEGYLEQRTPALRPIVDSRSPVRDPYAAVKQLGIRDGVDAFIARHTAEISCATCSREEARYLSLPWNFVQMRKWLDDAIRTYERTELELRGPIADWIEVLADAQARVEWACDLTRRAECPVDGGTWSNCPGFDNRRANPFWCGLEAAGLASLTLAGSPLEPAIAPWRTFTTTFGPLVLHARGWRRSIDEGLVRWVHTGHRIAEHLFYNPRGMDMAAALAEIKAFAPVAAEMATGIDLGLIVKLQNGLRLAKAPIEELERVTADMFERAFKKLIGISPSELQEKYVSAHAFIDPTLGAGTLLALDRSMKLPTAADDDFRRYPREPITRFDWRTFPAAYNSVTLIKLSLLAPAEVNRLYRVLAELSPRASLPRRVLRTGSPPDNIMLGWGHTIDGSNQWLLGMPLAENDCALYRRIFARIPPGPAAFDRGLQHPAEPKDACTTAPPLYTVDVDHRLLAPKGSFPLTVSEDVDLVASAGVITPCRSAGRGTPCTATFTAPQTDHDLDVIVTVTPKVPDPRRPPIDVWVQVRPELELRVVAPDVTAPEVELVGAGATLRPRQRVTLELGSGEPATWTLEGRGVLAAVPTTTARAEAVATSAQALDAKRKALVLCREAACIKRVQADLAKVANRLAVAERAAAADDLAANRRVYVAPLAGAGRAVIRARTPDGRTAQIEFALRGKPRMPLKLASPTPTLGPGQAVQLEVQPPVPMKWTIAEGGVGAIGVASPAERDRLAQQIAPLHRRLATLPVRDARFGAPGRGPMPPMAPRTRARAELERYVRDDVAKLARPLAELAKLANTYRAPAKIARPTTVTITGVAQDGTGRRVTAKIQITPTLAPLRPRPPSLPKPRPLSPPATR